MALSEQLINDLINLVDETNVLLDESDLQHYGGDWCRQYSPNPSAIVFPRSTEQVQSVLKWANENQVAIVPSGGRTGLSGGATAMNGEVVVALDKMNRVVSSDTVAGTITVEAGMVTQVLQAEAEAIGWYYPVDFASSGSSQIGGNISTNAGGIKVIRYGMTRDWVLGLTVVTAAGEILHLNNGLLKNNTGYDLRHLFVGSEGTLGLIVEATIGLTQPPKASSVLVLGLESMESMMPLLAEFKARCTVNAFEFFSLNALRLNQQHTGVQAPFETECPYYALIEVEVGSDDADEAVLASFEKAFEAGWIIDGVMSQSEQQAQSLWALREGISESLAPYTPYKNDLSVLTSKVPEFLAEVDAIAAQQYPEFEVVWFGHIGDGNLHLNILKPRDWEVSAFVEKCKAASEQIFAVVQRLQGSVSAEHGVGLLKKHALTYTRSHSEIQLMKQIKAAFDPKGIMNPGKVLD